MDIFWDDHHPEVNKSNHPGPWQLASNESFACFCGCLLSACLYNFIPFFFCSVLHVLLFLPCLTVFVVGG